MAKQLIDETNNSQTSKPDGKPRGKAAYMKTDGIYDMPRSWEAKIEYWRKMIEKLIGYETLE